MYKCKLTTLRCSKIFVFVALTYLLFRPLIAIPAEKSNFIFYTSSVSDALGSNTVILSYEDSLGYMWFVTQEGLHKYDGSSVTTFITNREDEKSLISRTIVGIHEISKDAILIFTDIGIQVFHRKERQFEKLFLTIEPEDSMSIVESVTATTGACNKAIIFSIEGKGIYILEESSVKARKILDITEVHKDAQLITAMSLVDCNDLWFSVKGIGLVKYGVGSNAIIEKFTGAVYPDNNLKDIIDIKADRNGSLWISTSAMGVLELKIESKIWSSYLYDPDEINSISSDFTRRIFIDKDGLVWIATHNSLNLYDQKSKLFISFGLTAGLPSDDIVSVFQNMAGVYWIGTRGGLVTGYRSMMQTISTTSGLSNDGVNAIYQSNDGSVWVGTDDGLNRISPAGVIEEIINENHKDFPILDNTIMSILVEEDVVWVGTARAGLYKLNLTDRTYHRYYWDPASDSSLGANGVSRIVRLTSGGLLVGTYGGGLSKLNELDHSFKNYTSIPDDESTISDNHVLDILQQKNGALWVGTERGLNLFSESEEKFTRYLPNNSREHGLSDNFSWQLYEDSSENLWVGTRNGIFLLQSIDQETNSARVFQDLSITIGLISNQIYAIGEDYYGNIWMSHNRGLTRYDPFSGESQEFDLSDERARVEFNHAAIFIDSEKRLLFGHNKGFSIVDARQIPVREYAPKVAVTSLSVLGRDLSDRYPLHAMEKLVLKPSEANFSLGLSVMDYRNPVGNRLAYKLEGLDRDWIDIGSSRSVTISAIPSGEYLFRAKAITSDGIVNDEALSFKIVQLPPIWATSFAYAFYFLITLSVAIGLLRLSAVSRRATTLRQLELERLVADRTKDLESAKREAERASASKSTFMATITHEIRTPMHGVLGMTELLMRSDLNQRQYEFASAAYGSGVQLLDLINSILDFSKSEAVSDSPEISRINLAELIDEVTILFYPAAQKKSIDLYADFRISSGRFFYSDKRKILQILKNIVNNSVKFTLSGRICVRVDLLEGSPRDILIRASEFPENSPSKSIRISVIDTGIGISEESIERVFEPFYQADASDAREFGGTGLGLSICKKYAQVIGGSLLIRSEKGVGTQVDLVFPSLANDIEKFEVIDDDDKKCDIRFPKFACVNFFGICEDRARAFLNAMSFYVPGFNAAVINIVDNEPVSDCLGMVYMRINNQNLPCLESQLSNDLDPFCLDIKACQDAPVLDEASVLMLAPFTLEKMGSNLINLMDSFFKGSNYIGTSVLSHSASKFADESINREQGLSDLRVLVAEDIPVNQKIVSEMLCQIGVTFEVTSNGLEVFSKFALNPDYDIIFMDCQMPVLDGFEATKRIRDFERSRSKDYSGSRRVSIVALTAGESSDELSRCYEAGMDEVIVKPYSFESLRGILKKYSNGSIRVFSELGDGPLHDYELNESSDVDEGAIDISAIKQIFDIEVRSKKVIFGILLEEFERAYSDSTSKIEKSLQCKDFKEVKFTAHSLRGIASNLGAKNLVAILKEIESSSVLGNSSYIEAHLLTLHQGKEVYMSAVRRMEERLGRVGRFLG